MSTVLISGANRGLGALTALEFARAGHRVFAGVRTPDALSSVARVADDEHLDVQPVALDVTVPGSPEDAIDAVVGAAGSLDVVVSNAGIVVGGPIELVGDDATRDVFEVNTFGALRLIRAALPVMRRQGRGTIVAVGSLNGRVPAPGMGMYAASKQALAAALEALSFEVEDFGIRVTSLEPGPYRTQISGSALRTADHGPYQGLMTRLGARTMGRLDESGDPAEVARAVVAEATADRPRLHVAVGRHAEAALGSSGEAFSEAWLAQLRGELAAT